MESRTTSQSQMASLNTSQSSLLKVSDHQLNAKFRSKRDLYKYLTEMRKIFAIFVCDFIYCSALLFASNRMREQGLLEVDLGKPEATVAFGLGPLHLSAPI